MAKLKQAQFDEKYLWMGGGLLAVVLVIYVMGRQAGKEANDDPTDANPNVNAITVQTENKSIEWNPSALIKQIHTTYTVNWITGRGKVTKDIADLQDIQLRHLAQGYLETYGTTLRKVLNSVTWSGDSFSWNMIIRRMDALEIP
jgi:hypothetical protein